MQTRRHRGAKKAKKVGVEIIESNSWREYWAILTHLLEETYGVKPVHSLKEIGFLKKEFNPNIRLFTANYKNEVLAGVVIYESEMVAHSQYIAASDQGQRLGALDLLFTELLETTFSKKKYFDFGNSNGLNGEILNKGLNEFKEGFGARTIAHNFYQVVLQ